MEFLLLLAWVLPVLVGWLIIYTAVKLAVRHALEERGTTYDQVRGAIRDALAERDTRP